MRSYTLHITLYDLAFFGMLFIGSTLASGLWFTKKAKQAANRFLAVALVIAVLWLVRMVAIDGQLSDHVPFWSRLPMQYSLALGPLIYFYVRKLTQPECPFRRKDLGHFAPLLSQFSVQAIAIVQSARTGKETYDTVVFQHVNPWLNLLSFISVIAYLWRCRTLIRDFYQHIKFTGGDRYRYEMRWLDSLLTVFGGVWLLWIPFTAVRFYYQSGVHIYYPLYLLLMIMMLWMAARAFLRLESATSTPAVPILKPLMPVDLKQKGIWLKKVVKQQGYYYDPQLSLNLLAEKLGLTVHELSRIINQSLRKNFNDFINEYRVADVIRKMQDPAFDHLNLLGIAYESGFNSKTTFYRIFKEMTGENPAAYKIGLKKEVPSYNMELRAGFAPLISNHGTTLKWTDDKLKRKTMFKNSFKTAWRNLKKNKTYSLLNILGLTIGTISAALIFLWVEDEVNFNHNFAKRDYLYHVMQNEKSEAGINTNGSTPGPLAAALKTDIPGVVNSGRLSWAMDELAQVGEKSIKVNGMYGDPSVLDMYTLPFVYGNRAAALNNPDDVVISEAMAHNFFGNANPVGKIIKMNAKGAYSVDGLYKVTGVFKDLPANCYYHFQWLSPYTTWENANTWLKPWSNNLTETIIELSPKTDPAVIDQKLKNYLSTKVDKAVNQLFLFNMNDWHLRANFVNGKQNGGVIKYVRLFSTIALIILLIACINFMNLSTARSEQRGKEVGVLKVIGADKTSLIGKFLSESILLSFIAILFAIVLLYLLMPFYNELVQKQLSVDLFNPVHIGCLLAIGLIAGFVAGCYPAFYLSSFNPIKVLKGVKLKNSGSVIFIRKGLVITQFAASVMLIISTIVVYKQVQYIKNRNLGYNKNNLIYMDVQGNMKDHFDAIKNSLLATGYVENVAKSLHDALHIYSVGDGFSWQGKDPGSRLGIHSNVVTPEYLKTMHMQLADGRDFYPGVVDSTKVIINESMANLMGKEGKVGRLITAGKHTLTIVGIVKDFVYNDIYGGSAPLVLLNGAYSATVVAIRFKDKADLSQALAQTADVMKKENPGFPFEYRFADKDFDNLFASETLIGRLAGVFAMLAVFISCLGLFGLAAYTAERRTKEIGIRKVLGASVAGLTGLLTREFLQLVTVSCIIAFPLAWWLMHNWLQNYAYRTTIQYWMFLLAGMAALLIALVTVSFQTLSAAMANPVKSLRSE